MFFAASTPAAGPAPTTTVIAVSVGAVLTIGLTFHVVRSLRANQRLARQMGGMTPTERSLGRSHGALIVCLLLVTMGLGIGSVVSEPVRDVLSRVGDHSRWLPLALTPLVLVYGRWLGRTVRRAARERADLHG